MRPLGGTQDARDDVEGKDALDAGILAVDGEGDALVHEQVGGQTVLPLQVFRAETAQRFRHHAVGAADRAVGNHLVPGVGRGQVEA